MPNNPYPDPKERITYLETYLQSIPEITKPYLPDEVNREIIAETLNKMTRDLLFSVYYSSSPNSQSSEHVLLQVVPALINAKNRIERFPESFQNDTKISGYYNGIKFRIDIMKKHASLLAKREQRLLTEKQREEV